MIDKTKEKTYNMIITATCNMKIKTESLEQAKDLAVKAVMKDPSMLVIEAEEEDY